MGTMYTTDTLDTVDTTDITDTMDTMETSSTVVSRSSIAMLLGGVVVVFLILLSAGGVAVWYIQNMDDIALEGTVPEDDVAAGEEAAEEPAIPPADEEPPLAPGEARFTVTHPNPKKLVVSCGGDSVSGVNSARLVASLESTCSVKFIASDRSRNTTKVKFFPGEWACFANDSDECVNPDVPVEVPEPTAADGEQAEP